MSAPCERHIHIPLSIELRCSGVKLGSYLGPPGAAAVICAAIPLLILLFVSLLSGPTVVWLQPG
nr:MAG TPA: hypothetical protein [Caudoviricetes sp.]